MSKDERNKSTPSGVPNYEATVNFERIDARGSEARFKEEYILVLKDLVAQLKELNITVNAVHDELWDLNQRSDR